MLMWMIIAICFFVIALVEGFYILYKSTHGDRVKSSEIESQLLKTEKELRTLGDLMRNIK